MIFNLNQLKKDIEMKKEIVLINSNQTLEFIKALYNDLSEQSITIGEKISNAFVINTMMKNYQEKKQRLKIQNRSLVYLEL